VRVEQGKHLLFRNPSSGRNTLRLNPRIGDRNVRVQARARRSHSVHGDGIGRPEAVLLPISLNTAGDGIDQLFARRPKIAPRGIRCVVGLVDRLARIVGIRTGRDAWPRMEVFGLGEPLPDDRGPTSTPCSVMMLPWA